MNMNNNHIHLQQRAAKMIYALVHGQNSQFTLTSSKTIAASECPQIHAFTYVFSVSK